MVDVQQEHFDGVLEVQYPPRDATLSNIVGALDAVTQHDIPVAVVPHELPEDAVVFAVGSPGWMLHPEIERRLQPTWRRASNVTGSVFAGTDVAEWLAEPSTCPTMWEMCRPSSSVRP